MHKSFKEMPVWQLVMEVSEKIFYLTKDLPRNEDYGLTSQIRRSALSISANIAEGFGRNSIGEKMQFYSISRGSLLETMNHLEYGIRVSYFSCNQVTEIEKLLARIHKEINTILKTFKSQI